MEKTINQNESQIQSKYSVSPDTESFVDCLNALSEVYGVILNAIEQHYGEEQEDAIADRVISSLI